MIDPSIYDLTEETARYILAHFDLLGMFYIIGVLCTTVTILYYSYIGVRRVIKALKKGKVND